MPLAVLLGDTLEQRGQLVADARAAQERGEFIRPENQRRGVAILAFDPALAHVCDEAHRFKNCAIIAGRLAHKRAGQRCKGRCEAIIGRTRVRVENSEARALERRLTG